LTKKALIIDDDPELGTLIVQILKPIDVSVYQAFSGGEGLKLAYSIHPDLVILDVMMPGMDGFDVCSRLREMASIPILMLTARTNENDMLHGFNVGVDDFLRKPFSKNELEARVRALLRRSDFHKPVDSSYMSSYADSTLEIDLPSESVKLLGKPVEFSPREFALLSLLVREQGNVVSHREIIREAWGETYLGNTDTTSLYVYYVRNKLQDGKYGHQYIHTQWGRGYWFAPRKKEESN
jgi:DNA-binding response OmpR family regulator